MNKHKIYFLIAFLAVGSMAIALGIFPVAGIIPSNEIDTPKITPKSAGYWDLTGSPILIDGNWSDTQLAYPWCTGSGTLNKPYRIENVTIDGRQKSSCITIKNTNEYFVIQNCTFYNTTTVYATHYAGVSMENVNNSKITDCHFFNIGYCGIRADKCFSNAFLGNIMYNITNAIYTSYGSHNVIKNNNMSNPLNNSVQLSTAIIFYEEPYNDLINNRITNSPIGISYFYEIGGNISFNYISNCTYAGISYNGDYATIDRNNVTDVKGIGIESRGLYHNITNNIATYCGVGMGIYGDNSICFNNILTNNNRTIETLYTAGLMVAGINNTFYLNRFFNNEINVNDNRQKAGDNYWDNGTIGNYYSDYLGNDTNDDGIGDSAHRIPFRITPPEFNYDNYPIWWDAPVITVVSPTMSTYEYNPSFEISVDEGIEDSIWYTLDGGITNITSPGLTGSINETEWFGTPDGPIDITYYVNDSRGYMGMATVQVTKEIAAPDITFLNPAVGETFGVSPPQFIITITDLSSITGRWYTIDGGLHTFNFTGLTEIIDSEAWANATEGIITLTVYVMDDLGKIGSESRTITKNLPEGIPGYNIFIVIGAISVISLLAMKKKQKIRS